MDFGKDVVQMNVLTRDAREGEMVRFWVAAPDITDGRGQRLPTDQYRVEILSRCSRCYWQARFGDPFDDVHNMGSPEQRAYMLDLLKTKDHDPACSLNGQDKAHA